MASIIETYILAARVRVKVTRESKRLDPDLRRLVLNANLLDNLSEQIEENYREHRERAAAKTVYSASEQATVKFQECEAVLDDDSDDDEEYMSSHVYYSQEDSDSDDSDGDSDYEWDGDSDDEDLDVGEFELHNQEMIDLKKTESDPYHRKFREMPTMDELTESELDELEKNSSDSDSDSDSGSDMGDYDSTTVEKNASGPRIEVTTISALQDSSSEEEDDGEAEQCVITTTTTAASAGPKSFYMCNVPSQESLLDGIQRAQRTVEC